MNDTLVTENAVITSAFLGLEDHDIMSFMINLDFGSGSQGFGGWALDGNNGKMSWDYSMLILRNIMTTVGVRDWSKLKGTFVRIRRGPGWNSQIEEIGHIVQDKWFSPRKFIEEREKKE